MHGKLYTLKPRTLVLLKGNPLITGTRYQLERLRCALCGEQYQAQLPQSLSSRSKYDGSCSSSIAIARYYSGQPFKRTEQLQKLQGIPLADATQWRLVWQLYQIVLPVYQALERHAAQGTLFHYDDTKNRILEAYANHSAIHTTAFISKVNEHLIYLFFTGTNYAAKNAESLLSQRTTEEQLITMTDASSQNIPKDIDETLAARIILCFCLVHGRRKFYKVLNFFSVECEFVLNIISSIYQHENYCKEKKLTADERLIYHQKHSAPLVESLWIWLKNQLLYEQIEENSGLGEAVRYMLRHWQALTRFLTVPGAPIDNSLCEQAIKVAIRHRRNSLFYKTFRGANVGDCLMSLTHTAAKNGINIFDYLNALQRYASAVHEQPEDWLPWNYLDAMENQKQAA